MSVVTSWSCVQTTTASFTPLMLTLTDRISPMSIRMASVNSSSSPITLYKHRHFFPSTRDCDG